MNPLATLVLALAATAAAGGPDAAAPAAAETYPLRIGNRMYPEWKEEVRVPLNDEFYLGDTEFTARIVEYLPDFRIQDGQPISVSEAPNNPAILIVVYQESAPVDSAWAFRNFPPHFSPDSFFTFQLLGDDDPGATAVAENQEE